MPRPSNQKLLAQAFLAQGLSAGETRNVAFSSKPLLTFMKGKKNLNLNSVIAHLRNRGSRTKAAVLGLLGVEEGETRTIHENTWKVHSSAAVSPSAVASLTQMSLVCRDAVVRSIPQVSLCRVIRQPASIPGADRAVMKHICSDTGDGA